MKNGSHKKKMKEEATTNKDKWKSAGRLVRRRNCVEERETRVRNIERKRRVAQLERLCEEDNYFAYVDSFVSVVNQVDLSEEDQVAMFVEGLKEGSTKLIKVLNL